MCRLGLYNVMQVILCVYNSITSKKNVAYIAVQARTKQKDEMSEGECPFLSAIFASSK